MSEIRVPQIGDIFLAHAFGEVDSYRVSAFLKPAPPVPTLDEATESARDFGDILGWVLDNACQPAGPDRIPLMWCSRDEAVYVSGSGVCGIIARITDIQVTGRVNWPQDLLDSEIRSAQVLEGERLS